MIKACPECDDSSIVHSKQSSLASDTEEYRCTACGNRFEEAVERERQSNTNSVKGLARELDRMDPEDI